jgi:integrase
MMRYIFNLAVRWDVPGIKANPTKGVPLIEENNKRERYLSVEEAQKLYGAVCSSENTMLKFIVPMLILTGARKREVLDARWEDFDLARRVWRIPITKSGKARRVPLSDGALTLLATMPRKSDCPWAFANPATDKPYVSFFCAWDTARKKVGLQDVCVHSLRHSHASFLINAGRTLYEVQNILGHTQVKTTQRYAHLSHDTLLDATNSVNTTLAGMFVPMVSASPVGQAQLAQWAETPNFNPVAFRTALSVLMVGLPRVESVRYKVSRERCAFSAIVDMPPRASTTFLRAVR